MNFFLNKAKELNYIIKKTEYGFNCWYCLNVEGWKRLDEIKRNLKDSSQAFVAMWFNAKMQDAYSKGFYPALSKTDYNPLKIDDKEHNNKICDEIEAEIKKSSLLVADLTGHRPGVYYEAGLAKGLGIPVIWSCHTDNFKERHFDINQYNCIEWNTPEDLEEKLIKRIEATLK